MSLAVYMDVHVPLAITEGLRRRAIDVITSQEDQTTLMDDDALLERASGLGRLLFTQDQDFLRIGANWSEAGRSFFGILYAHQLNSTLGQIVEDIELIATCCGSHELMNRTIFLPLRARR
jgi:hypothetical protein